MRPILPNKTEFIPHAPQNEHEIFMAMRTYPDNVKVYHPHGQIDATSVFWHNKLHPNALNFAVYVDPKATEQPILFKRVLGDIQKLAWKFSDDRMITRDYAPQHPFNNWLTRRQFQLVKSTFTANLEMRGLSLSQGSTSQAVKTFAEISSDAALYQHVLQKSMAEYSGKPTFNPAIGVPIDDWQALISHNQIVDAPFAVMDQNDTLTAFSFLYQLDQAPPLLASCLPTMLTR
nr:hypothetical protein [Lentilactobacillus otakiensis]